MENYISNYESGEELQHYGVKGMRWGVRRASKQLSSATDSASRDKAVASLNKHRTKSTQKIQKLEKKQEKLNASLTRSGAKDVAKAAKLEKKASKLDSKVLKYTKKSNKYKVKAGKKFFSDSATKAMVKGESYSTKAQITKAKADALHSKAKSYSAKYESAKAKIDSNERMIAAFKKGINDIDTALETKGRRYING